MAGIFSRQLAQQSLVLCLATGFGAAAFAADEGKVFYRYVNKQGIKVLHHSIPPEYAQKGYEVVSLSGKVIRTVDPAPTAEELAAQAEAQEREQALKAWDMRLHRRYSSVADIEATKKRKLADLQSDIAIVRSNIASKQGQIAAQQRKAADIERAGRAVPESILKVLAAKEIELEDAQEQVRLRLIEFKEVGDKFDRDIERFKQISKP